MKTHSWCTVLAACGIGCLVAWNTSASAQVLRIQGSSSVSNGASKIWPTAERASIAS